WRRRRWYRYSRYLAWRVVAVHHYVLTLLAAVVALQCAEFVEGKTCVAAPVPCYPHRQAYRLAFYGIHKGDGFSECRCPVIVEYDLYIVHYLWQPFYTHSCLCIHI